MRSRARLADSKVHEPEEGSMVTVEDSKTFVLRSMRKQLREGDKATRAEDHGGALRKGFIFFSQVSKA